MLIYDDKLNVTATAETRFQQPASTRQRFSDLPVTIHSLCILQSSLAQDCPVKAVINFDFFPNDITNQLL